MTTCMVWCGNDFGGIVGVYGRHGTWRSDLRMGGRTHLILRYPSALYELPRNVTTLMSRRILLYISTKVCPNLCKCWCKLQCCLLPFHTCNILQVSHAHTVCVLASLTFSPAAFSPFVSFPCSNLLSFAVATCPACPPCFSPLAPTFFPPFVLSLRILSSSSASLTFAIASSKLGILKPMLLASFNLCALAVRPLFAARTSLSRRSLMRISMRWSSVRMGVRSSTGAPKGATMAVTTWRMCLEVRQPEAMRTMSPSTRELFGSATRWVVGEGKCWGFC